MNRRKALLGLAAPLVLKAFPAAAAHTMDQWDLLPTSVTQAEAITWQGVANWGGEGVRLNKPHSLAYVGNRNGQPTTCFSCFTRGFEPVTKVAERVAFLVFIDSLAGASGWVRLTSLHYDANGANGVWKDDWHVPLTPNPANHPSAVGVYITDLWNQRIPSAVGTVNFSVDVLGSGRIYGARLAVMWEG